MNCDGVFGVAHPAQVAQRTRNILLEIFGAWLLLELALWSDGAAQFMFGVSAVGLMTALNVRAGLSAREQGLSFQNARRWVWLLPAAIAISGLVLATAFASGTLTLSVSVAHAIVYAGWAFLQEWMALSFIFVRLEKIVPPHLAVIVMALIFAAAHLPNLSLTLATFGMAAVFAVLFRTYRSIWPLAFMHAILGLCIAVSVPPDITHFMKVGAKYLR